ncbi:MAG: CbbQ/NirQ/NorQ/GpvN family protein [bacterium]
MPSPVVAASNVPHGDRGVRRPAAHEPFYLPIGNERELFSTCFEQQLPILLKGPTGTGKSRFVEHMAWRLGRPLITVACHDDLSASDLTGRYLIQGSETVWHDGPLTRAARIGAICYLDELVEARQDTTVVIHPLTDDRRVLPIEKTGDLVEAAPGFLLVASYNPGYQRAIKDLKPSTRQRFVSLEFDFPPARIETEIVMHEGGIERPMAASLVDIAGKVRNLRDQGLPEGPGTRLLVATARLIARGISPRDACHAAMTSALTDDPDLLSAIDDVVSALL